MRPDESRNCMGRWRAEHPVQRRSLVISVRFRAVIYKKVNEKRGPGLIGPGGCNYLYAQVLYIINIANKVNTESILTCSYNKSPTSLIGWMFDSVCAYLPLFQSGPV